MKLFKRSAKDSGAIAVPSESDKSTRTGAGLRPLLPGLAAAATATVASINKRR